jgi:hypothetical protein
VAQKDQQQIMNSLIDKGPEAWGTYLRPFEAGAPLGGLSMQVVFHHAALLAKKQGSLEWAEVAVRAADLEARHCSGVERENASLWAMNLRTWFICKVGSRPDNLVLDKSIILDWILKGLTFPLQTAIEKAASLNATLAETDSLSSPAERQRASEDLRELRRIKHRLNAAKMLADCNELPDVPILSEWLKVREQLP